MQLCKLRVSVFALLAVTSQSFAAAFTQDAASTAVPASIPSVDSGAEPALPTIAELNALRQSVVQDADLDEAIRTQVDLHFARAIEHLQTADQFAQQTLSLQKELESSPQRQAELEALLSSRQDGASSADQPIGDNLSVEQLSAGWQQAEQAVTGLRDRMSGISVESENRINRRPLLPDLRAQVESQQAEVAAQLSSLHSEGTHPEVASAQRLRLRLRQVRLQKEAALLDQEARTYEATTRVRTLAYDVLSLELRDAERAAQVWQQRLAAARQQLAKDQADAAQLALTRSHPAIKHEAQRNSELAEVNHDMTDSLRSLQVELEQVEDALEGRKEEYEAIQLRAAAAGYSPAVGVLLRNRRAQLPDEDTIRMRIRARQLEISTLNLQLMEWQAARKLLVDLDAATDEVMGSLGTSSERGKAVNLEPKVRELLSIRLNLLADLIETGNSKLDVWVRLDSEQKRLLKAVEEEAHWLAEHVLWVRSTGIIGSQMDLFRSSLRNVTSGGRWTAAQQEVSGDLSGNRWIWVSMLATTAGLLVVRRQLKRKLKELGELAERANCVTFLPTLKVLLYSALISLPFPVLIWGAGWRILTISRGENTLQALGISMQVVSAAWFLLAMIRNVGQPHGLGQAHFEWPESNLTTLRQTVRLLGILLLPALFVVAFAESLGDEDVAATIGRIAYILAITVGAVAGFGLLRPSSPVMQSLEHQHADGWLWRTRWLWTALIAISPVALIGLSATGFHYTAVQLTGRVTASVGCALGMLLITALLSRWLLVTYRSLAIRRGRERRQQLLQAAQAESDQPLTPDTTPELRLADVNTQARRLLRLAAGASLLAALYGIWIDVMPALGMLGRVSLGWDNAVAGLNPDGMPQSVTLADLVYAVALGAATLFAARNLPGLLEIAILQRLPMDAGARYAAGTVSRYVIVVTGIILAFRVVGIGWSSVQWLVAAMTVGLGFGLQEIFANFVSGIILLFERPIRVGDTVTIGEITGTVTRIQIRATTILDWDNKELIVPNREFVTGNLVNWTLANPTLRLVVGVGVAYGSDTRLATRLLYRIAKENPNVLDEPEPVVVFTEFGDSSLNFELRLYVSGLLHYRRLKHELNTAIDDAFSEHKIEIAFPQHDLHLRSMSPELIRHVLRDASRSAHTSQDVPLDQVGAA